MKLSKNALTTLLFLCLTFEGLAQYNLMRRGQVSAYDSSVNIEISEYRKIREKIFAADSLVQSLGMEVKANGQLNNMLLERDHTIARMQEQYKADITAQEKTISDLRRLFDNLAATSKKLRIFKDPTADTVSKVLLGMLAGYGVAKL